MVCMYVYIHTYVLYVQHLCIIQMVLRVCRDMMRYTYILHIYDLYVVWSVVLHLHVYLLRWCPVCQVPVCHLFLHSNN